MTLLQISDLAAFHGPSQALFGVELDIAEGEVVALLGRNGMGKTTTIRSVLGLCDMRGGDIRFSGQTLAGMKPHLRATLGIGLVPEGRRCFPTLTVEENLVVAARAGPWSLQTIFGLFPRLAERRRQYAGTLSGGEQQMLAIGRALMTNPRLLMLDEATEGLAPVMRQEIWRAIGQLKRQGQSLLIVDKILVELLPVADRCVVLERGRTVWSGSASKLNDELQSRYLGV
ncbi:ABC transporter ATP-binding protein [Taklimakanibacter deserti]|uniref:ABC transporter ATP-binding protein n=1 Tax=Taklimakanibacter deserti TaxID=2267839 RepID=UPI000E651687